MSHLISVAELAGRLDEVTVCDVRHRLLGPPTYPDFVAGHVPSAVFVDVDRELAAPAGAGGRHPLPDAEVFVAAMVAHGVSRDRPVVCYDDAGGVYAARAWWLLRDYGHPHVQVLDGGWPAWVRAGEAVETGEARPSRGDFAGAPGGMGVLTSDELSSVSLLLDARAPERFRGETEPIDPVAGHIPGAVNAPTGLNLNDDGTWVAREVLRERYAALGALSGGDVGAYCGSGVTACHTILSLAELGVDAMLYPGSWSGWITDPTRPIATGS